MKKQINNSCRKKMSKIVICLFVGLQTVSCVTLQPVSINQTESIQDYQYIYITPTNTVNSTSGGIYGNGYGVTGITSTKSANPTDLISGYFIKKGYTRLPDLVPNLLDKTLVVNYGESGSRGVLLGSVTEITIQFLSAKTMRPICVATSEGYGDTMADDIRIAINRCLDKLFE